MNNELPEDRPHATFGPSGLKMLKLCRGFKNRESPAGPAAEKGTRIHFAVEHRDPSELLDEEEYEIYMACLADLDRAFAELRESTGVEPVLHQELRLHMALGACETFGTADYIALAGNTALLADVKTGVSKIDEPPENWQSKAYAVGLFQMFPQIDHIRAVFTIPPRSEFLEGWYHRSELPTYIEELGTLIVEAAYVRRMWESMGAPPLELLEPGDQCRFCKWNEENRCPAMGALVYDVLKRYDAGGILPPEGSIHGSDIEDPEVLARLRPLAAIVEKWAGSVKRKSLEVALRGSSLPGYTLKSMGAPREIADATAAIEFAKSCGFDIDEILKAATFSLSKLSAVVKEKAPRGQKQEAVRAFEDGLETFGAIGRKAERWSLKPVSGEEDED